MTRARSVLIFHPSDEMYGADRVVLTLARVLAGGGTQVALALPQDVEYPQHALCHAAKGEDGPTVEVNHADWPVLRRAYLRSRQWRLLSRWYSWVRIMRRSTQRPCLVLANTSASLAATAFHPLAPGGRRVLYLHESLGRYDRLLLRPLIRRMDLIIAVSEASAGSLPSRARQRTKVVWNGFEDRLSDESRWRKQGPIQFLLASRWNTWKGHELFLEAWRAANTRGKHLVILGGMPPSGSSFDVQAYVHDHVVENVTIVGETDSVDSFIDESDVVVVPSQAPDPLPTIAIEALRGGRPVAASSAGGLVDIVPSDAGWLFPIGDVGAWTRFIENVDRSECRARSHGARNHFVRSFSLDRYEAEIVSALRAGMS